MNAVLGLKELATHHKMIPSLIWSPCPLDAMQDGCMWHSWLTLPPTLAHHFICTFYTLHKIQNTLHHMLYPHNMKQANTGKTRDQSVIINTTHKQGKSMKCACIDTNLYSFLWFRATRSTGKNSMFVYINACDAKHESAALIFLLFKFKIKVTVEKKKRLCKRANYLHNWMYTGTSRKSYIFKIQKVIKSVSGIV